MMDEDARSHEFLHRLQTAAGHLNAVMAMADAGRNPAQILHQLKAVQAALQCAARYLVEKEFEETIRSAHQEPSEEGRMRLVNNLIQVHRILMG